MQLSTNTLILVISLDRSAPPPSLTRTRRQRVTAGSIKVRLSRPAVRVRRVGFPCYPGDRQSARTSGRWQALNSLEIAPFRWITIQQRTQRLPSGLLREG